MKNLLKTILTTAMLLTSAAAFANEAHHTAGAAAEKPAAEAPVPAPQSNGGGMTSGGMMSQGGMMSGGMMSGDMMQMMGMMSANDGPARQMMSPDHVEGRIAFLQAELKLTDAQQPLWKAVADALRANAKLAKETMAGMGGAMTSANSDAITPLTRIDQVEQMLSTRLEGLRQLKVVIEPFYATLDEAQKALADQLLVPAPMGMM